MKRFATIATCLLAGFVETPASAGLQVTTCENLGTGVWRYTFFACAPNIEADGLQIRLTPAEISQGEEIYGAYVPALPVFGSTSTATVASYSFPVITPFHCVPDVPGDSNKFAVEVATGDGLTVVEEIWTLGGVEKAGFISVFACPPVSVEEESWGRIKTLYR